MTTAEVLAQLNPGGQPAGMTSPALAEGGQATAQGNARAATTLSYALDLTVARRLDEARKRALESWSYRPSLAAAKQLGKILLMQMIPALRS